MANSFINIIFLVNIIWEQLGCWRLMQYGCTGTPLSLSTIVQQEICTVLIALWGVTFLLFNMQKLWQIMSQGVQEICWILQSNTVISKQLKHVPICEIFQQQVTFSKNSNNLHSISGISDFPNVLYHYNWAFCMIQLAKDVFTTGQVMLCFVEYRMHFYLH